MSENKIDAVVEFRDVEYRASPEAKPIIVNLNFTIGRGETLVLLGESGCGKTTTLRLINRLLTPTSGEVLIEGRATAEWDAIRLRRSTGYVIQDGGLFPHFTVEENIALVPRLEGWKPQLVHERVRQILEMVGLDPGIFAARYLAELSGGQRQRVGVGRALAFDPPLLLLDEPFGALDPVTRAALQREFIALTRSLGKTSVFVTHDVREALLVGTRIGLMRAGEMLLLVSPEDFLRSPNEYARAYRETLEIH